MRRSSSIVKTVNNKPKPFVAPGSNIKPTIEEIKDRELRIKRADEIGASITRVTDEQEYENPYRVKALIYINANKEVPEELKQKIKEFDNRHTKALKTKQQSEVQ